MKRQTRTIPSARIACGVRRRTVATTGAAICRLACCEAERSEQRSKQFPAHTNHAGGVGGGRLPGWQLAPRVCVRGDIRVYVTSGPIASAISHGCEMHYVQRLTSITHA